MSYETLKNTLKANPRTWLITGVAGERTTLNELFNFIKERVVQANPAVKDLQPTYRDFRAGDVSHSLADISKAREKIGYEPRFSVKDGLDQATKWYLENLS